MIKPKKQQRKVWVEGPPKIVKPKVPDDVKKEVETKADALIESFLKPSYVRPPPVGLDTKYIVDIYGLWYRNYFYFCSKYRCPSPRAIEPFFEDRFARMEYIARNSFNLAWMRHTGQWWPSSLDASLEECLNKIKNDPWFRPYF